MNQSPVLYGLTVSPYSMRVNMQIKLKGLPIEMVDPPGGHHSDEYLAFNPIDKVPTLRIGDEGIPESEVIGSLLERLYPDMPLLPAGPLEEARVRLISRVVDLYVMSTLLPMTKPGPDYDTSPRWPTSSATTIRPRVMKRRSSVSQIAQLGARLA